MRAAWHFDAFARENLLFDAAYSASNWTNPAIVTLFTSLYPSQHGIHSLPGAKSTDESGSGVRTSVLSAEFTTMAEVLKDNGFRTAAFVGNPWLKREFDFAQGFDHYNDALARWDVPGDVVSKRAIEWLEAVGPSERFFLYLHYMDTHRPYGRLNRFDVEIVNEQARAGQRQPTGAVRDELAELILLSDGTRAVDAGIAPSFELFRKSYDRGIEKFDRALGRLLKFFETHEAHGRTAIVIVSDHGEALFTRGWGNHGRGLYEGEIAISLAARLPGVTSRAARVTSPVGLDLRRAELPRRSERMKWPSCWTPEMLLRSGMPQRRSSGKAMSTPGRKGIRNETRLSSQWTRRKTDHRQP